MYNLVLVLHVVIAIGLIGAILIQRGRSGGLVEALGGVESIFGTKTSSFFVKLTVVLAILFFVTSISLAYISKQQGKSLFSQEKAANVGVDDANQEKIAKDVQASSEEIPDPLESKK